MAVTINRKANTMEFTAAADSYTVLTNEEFNINQVIWYAYTAAADNLVIQINGENWIKYQAGATSGAQRVPANTKWLKTGDVITVTTMDHGSLIMMLEETHG